MSEDDIANELYDRFNKAIFTIWCDGCQEEIDIEAVDKEEAVGHHWRLCKDCGNQIHRNFRCQCGGNPWFIRL